jgi:hypothetical protein
MKSFEINGLQSMKLSKAQLQYIGKERLRMDARVKDLESFGDVIYKNSELSAELSRCRYDLWFLNHLIKLHNVEVEAEKEMSK